MTFKNVLFNEALLAGVWIYTSAYRIAMKSTRTRRCATASKIC